MTCRSHPAGSSNSGRYPDVGSQCRVDANSAMSRYPHPEIGYRYSELACDADDCVADPALVQCGPDACGQRDEQGDDDPDHTERDGGGKAFEQRDGHGVAVAETHAEVAGERRTHVAEELLDERPVHSARRTQCVVGLRGVAGAERDAHGIARHQVHERENHDQHADQDDNRIEQSPRQEAHDRIRRDARHWAPPSVMLAVRKRIALSRRASYPDMFLLHAWITEGLYR